MNKNYIAFFKFKFNYYLDIFYIKKYFKFQIVNKLANNFKNFLIIYKKIYII